jgi:hypothetical protein
MHLMDLIYSYIHHSILDKTKWFVIKFHRLYVKLADMKHSYINL